MNKDSSPIKFIWIAFVAVPVILYYVLTQAIPESTSTGLVLAPPVVYTLLIIATAAAWFVPRLILQQKMSPYKRNEKPYNLYFPVFIIRMAMAEGIAILGFALSFGTGNVQQYVIFAACSFGLTVLSFPTDQRIEDRQI